MKASRLVALVAAGALAWLVYALSSAGPGPTDDGAAPEVAAPQPEPAAAETGTELEKQPPAGPAETTAEAPDRQPPAESPGQDLDTPGEGLSLAGLARREAFLAEARSADWADAEQARLSASLRALPVQSGHFAGAECRSSLCKLSFEFDGEAALPDNQPLFEELRRMFGMDLASERHVLPDGDQRVTLYVQPRH